MNKRTTRLLMDGLIATALVVLWRAIGFEWQSTESLGVTLAIGLVPLIWLGLRHGSATAIVFAAIAGAINLILSRPEWDWITKILTEVTPLLAAGIAGVFAKYTQKTLNNRRLSSTYLNIVTASLLVSLVYFALRYVVIPMVLPAVDGLALNQLPLWGGWLATTAIAAVVLILMGRINQSLIIPKRSKYLSRKETSSLLND